MRSKYRLKLAILVCLWAIISCDDSEKGQLEFDYKIYTHKFDKATSGISTGDFYQLAISYPPIEVDSKYKNVISFLLDPFSPPVRSAIPSNGPLILFTDDLEVIVFSPLNHFFITLVNLVDGKINYGIEGFINEIPKGFNHKFILVKGKGINATIERWGELLLAEYGATKRDRYADFGTSYLGYWTDNGAAYYYRTIPDKNYEETLLMVKEDADTRAIPFKYFQINSWWYYRGYDTLTTRGGIIRWEPKPEIFPHGIAYFQQMLGLPLIAHFKWFEKDNVYRNDYVFVEGERCAIPWGQELYDKFMEDCVNWGIKTFEPDWLNYILYWRIPFLLEGVENAEKWMKDQNNATSKRGITMQLCMAGTAHMMYSVEMPVVTTIRTSIDYHANISKEAFWPMFHIVNMIANATGLLPFKDNFWTAEKCGEQETLISVLSAGMVGNSDFIGEAKPELLLKTCRKDGLLLKPDKPATPIDRMFLPHNRPFTVSTYSKYADLGQWTYLAAFHLASEHPERTSADKIFAYVAYDGRDLKDMFVFPDVVTDWNVNLSLDVGIEEDVVVYNWRTGEAFVNNGSFKIPEMEHLYDYAYFIIAPILYNGLALIGEKDKFITMADKRFSNIEVLNDGLKITLAGVPGETVSLLAYDTIKGEFIPEKSATINQEGSATVLITRQ